MITVQRVLNLTMRATLATPLLNRAVRDRVLIIDVVGRKTGHIYRIPVGYVATADGLLIGTAGRWRRNLGPDQPVQVIIGRTRHDMVANVITDEERCAVLYRTILEHNPVHGRYAHIHVDADGGPNRDDLRRALEEGIAVVHLRPAPDPVPAASDPSVRPVSCY